LSIKFEEESRLKSDKKKEEAIKRKKELHLKLDFEVFNKKKGENERRITFRNSSPQKETDNISQKQFNIYSNFLYEKERISLLEKEKELDGVDKEKIISNKKFERRELRSQSEFLKLTKSYYKFKLLEYHYVYNYPYKKPKLGISCFKENEELITNNEDSLYLNEDYERSYPQKLLREKNLERYDCWEDIHWTEWMEICKNNTSPYDGKSPTYFDGK